MNANILGLSTQFSFRPCLHEGEEWEKLLQLSSVRVSSEMYLLILQLLALKGKKENLL